MRLAQETAILTSGFTKMSKKPLDSAHASWTKVILPGYFRCLIVRNTPIPVSSNPPVDMNIEVSMDELMTTPSCVRRDSVA